MNILYISACVRENSRTRRLAKRLLDKLEGDITTVELAKENILPLNEETLAQRDDIIRRGDCGADMLLYARELAAAD
ncbi:MAG: NAD(P)H-dependent oxidoreductase, partial [Oscillospiraceae bacterium]